MTDHSSEDWKDLIYPENNTEEHPKKRKKRRGRSPLPLLFAAVVILALVFLIVHFMPTGKHMDSRAYFEDMLSRDGAAASLAEDELAVVLEDTVSESKARRIDGGLYLDYEMARKTLSSRFFWDEENSTMLFTTAYETYEIPVNSTAYTVDGEERSYDRPIVVQDERGMFLSAAFLAQYTNLEYAGDYENGDHVLIHYDWGEHLTATASKNSAVRYYGGIKSLIIDDVAKGETLWVLDQMKRWSRGVTADGYIGYIQNRHMTEPETTNITRDFDGAVYPSLSLGETVNLVWHMINTGADNANFASDTKGMTGVNVISPTWFFLSDNEGNFDSLASSEYVAQAHKKGLQVWGLVSNFSPDMKTTVLVASTKARRNLVNNLVEAALACGLDGINVDLEAIAEEAGYGYVQFMRELSIACRKNELFLSVDVPVPFSFNAHYDWKELGAVCDYVIMMGYDEHYVGSEAGSVASLSFEEDGLKAMLEDVPAEKIISGVPFYTRMWYTTVNEAGEENTWSEELGMRAVLNTLETYGVEPEWDDDAKQYLAQWTLEDGTLCRIWMEEETSLALKAALVKKYKLGGIAEWVLGSQIDEMWQVISENIA